MAVTEEAFCFPNQDIDLVGVLHRPEECGEGLMARGVLIIVGGPQYRVGSHRQFLLLARMLADNGIPVMRFDFAGMGDSGGAAQDFETVGEDVRCALDHFFHVHPDLNEVVIWGLCDAASAALFYAHKDERVKGLILLNPWVRTDEGIAKAYLKHYYLSRLMNPDLWRKIITGQFNFKASFVSLFDMLKSAIGISAQSNQDSVASTPAVQNVVAQEQSLISTPLPDRMLQGLHLFKGRVLLILSGDDLTADEFRDVIGTSRKWQKCLKNVDKHTLEEANHTFSQRQWRDQVSQWTCDWLKSF
ncbi:MAG: hydrolase 1, exosortase A system-associated [Thiohalomonadales bacterium]